MFHSKCHGLLTHHHTYCSSSLLSQVADHLAFCIYPLVALVVHLDGSPFNSKPFLLPPALLALLNFTVDPMERRMQIGSRCFWSLEDLYSMHAL